MAIIQRPPCKGWNTQGRVQGEVLTQGPNPCLLHWQADSLPLSHQRSPLSSMSFNKCIMACVLHFSIIQNFTILKKKKKSTELYLFNSPPTVTKHQTTTYLFIISVVLLFSECHINRTWGQTLIGRLSMRWLRGSVGTDHAAEAMITWLSKYW